VTDGVEAFNALPYDAAAEALTACLREPGWVASVLAGRPYPERASLLASAYRFAVELEDAALATALAAHPRIGERLASSSGAEAAHSASEQGGVDAADGRLADDLRAANLAYEQRFDRVFLIRAAGRDGVEILAAARERLTNDEETESRVVRDQLAQIARLRLEALLTTLAGPARTGSR
jgi:2-oxo-4-hydroxy-4-carboxy-5-ureidoimidazoline decarboxylase